MAGGELANLSSSRRVDVALPLPRFIYSEAIAKRALMIRFAKILTNA
jgi:hypothetical protein